MSGYRGIGWDIGNRIVPVVKGKTAAPGVSDDQYRIGTNWVDETNDRVYICVDNTAGAAVWLAMATALGGSVYAAGIITLDAAGNLAIPAAANLYTKVLVTVAANSGVTDNVDTVSGLVANQEIILSADTGDTITVIKSATLVLQANFILNNVDDRLVVLAKSATTVVELSRANNG